MDLTARMDPIDLRDDISRLRYRMPFAGAVTTAAIAGVLLCPVASWAQGRPGPGPAHATFVPARDPGPAARGMLGIEFAGTVAPEAWNLNGNHEWMFDGTVGVWWAYREGRTFGVEFHAVAVTQERPRNAFLNALTPVFRCRVWQGRRSTMFLEFGGGFSWSDAPVPPRGTRLNYLTMTSAGFTRRLSAQAHAVASVRWLHLSNASLEGRDRNPDIEAIGGFIGVSIGFPAAGR
jgi:hypothetical protein